jgi:hypothetical protein
MNLFNLIATRHDPEKRDLSPDQNKSLPATGSLAIEIFFGPGFDGGLRVPTREAVAGDFCRL